MKPSAKAGSSASQATGTTIMEETIRAPTVRGKFDTALRDSDQHGEHTVYDAYGDSRHPAGASIQRQIKQFFVQEQKGQYNDSADNSHRIEFPVADGHNAAEKESC